MADGELTQDELRVILKLVMRVQADVMTDQLGAKTVDRLARVFDGITELESVEPPSTRIVQGLERLNPRIRRAMGERVDDSDARPLR